MKWDDLRLTKAPWVALAPGPLGQVRRLIRAQADMLPGERVVEINGADSMTLREFYNCLGKSFDFPSYFGRNLNAMEECLTDGDIMGQHPTVVLITNSEMFLSDERPEAKEGVVDTFSRVGEAWSQPGPWPWHWKPTPFHTLFSVEHSANYESYSTLERIGDFR